MVLYIWKYVQPSGQYTVAPPYYEPDRVIDRFSSAIWCERYYEPGEFQLKIRATPELLRYFCDNELLVTQQNSERAMIPERIVLTTSNEDGNYLTVSGKSYESLLNRRIIRQGSKWTRNSGTGEQAIEYFAKNNILSDKYYSDPGSGDVYRFIPFLSYEPPASTAEQRELLFPERVEIAPGMQPLGETVSNICRFCGFGYRILFDIPKSKMTFSVYRGTDRTLLQYENNPVVFSPDFNTIGNTEYVVDRSTYCNWLYYKNGSSVRNAPADSRSIMGVTRRERVLENTESANTDADGTAYKEQTNFTGDVLPNDMFRYRADYFLGDTVTVQNALGITGAATITEVTEAEDETGYRLVPTFSEWRA